MQGRCFISSNFKKLRQKNYVKIRITTFLKTVYQQDEQWDKNLGTVLLKMLQIKMTRIPCLQSKLLVCFTRLIIIALPNTLSVLLLYLLSLSLNIVDLSVFFLFKGKCGVIFKSLSKLEFSSCNISQGIEPNIQNTAEGGAKYSNFMSKPLQPHIHIHWQEHGRDIICKLESKVELGMQMSTIDQKHPPSDNTSKQTSHTLTGFERLYFTIGMSFAEHLEHSNLPQ